MSETYEQTYQRLVETYYRDEVASLEANVDPVDRGAGAYQTCRAAAERRATAELEKYK